ncbi:hypothetical protein JHK82_052484 [Glycine max]|nr:hypothetical protein JHK82_052484 [Glycine max]
MSSGSTSILGGIPIHGGMSTLLRSNSWELSANVEARANQVYTEVLLLVESNTYTGSFHLKSLLGGEKTSIGLEMCDRDTSIAMDPTIID